MIFLNWNLDLINSADEVFGEEPWQRQKKPTPVGFWISNGETDSDKSPIL